jgi:hypothetical protein
MPDKQYGMQKRDLKELTDHGLLWLINRVVFHPRGYALGLVSNEEGEFDAWVMIGDGSEVWTFSLEDDNVEFEKVKEFFAAMDESPAT